MIERLRSASLRRRDGRPSLLRECGLLALLNVVYNAVVEASSGNTALALHNARGLERVEQVLGVEVEAGATRLLMESHVVATYAAVWYVVMQWAGAAFVLVWLWRSRPDRYRQARTAILVITGIGLVVFLLWPVAPPRLGEHGVVDVVAALRTPGSFHSNALKAAADQFGAFPSLHVAWALWCAWAVWPVHDDRWRAWGLRGLLCLYVEVTAAVVVLTGNHYVLDVIGGLLCVPAASALTWIASRAAGRVRNTAPAIQQKGVLQ